MENMQDGKKVLIFSTAYLPLVGGAEIAVKEITDRLPGYHFDMITARIKRGLPSFERVGRINVYRVGFGFGLDKFLLPVLGLWKARKLERKNHYHLTWSIMASFGGFLGLRFKKKYPQKPWLLTLQEGDAPELILKKVGFFKDWFYQIFRRADYVQSISSFLDSWAGSMGVGGDKRIVVPNGVDIRKFKKSPGEEDLKNQLGIKDEKIIFTASRLVYKNGIDDLIKAGRYLDFPFKILIAGTGEEEKNLRTLADDRVLFLGNISQDDLPKYYSLADVFVRPSRSEGFGISFLEAMACEVPFVAPAVGGICDFLRDGVVGYECRVDSPESVAEQIKRALKEKNTQPALSLVREKYTWDVIAPQMEKIFREL